MVAVEAILQKARVQLHQIVSSHILNAGSGVNVEPLGPLPYIWTHHILAFKLSLIQTAYVHYKDWCNHVSKKCKLLWLDEEYAYLPAASNESDNVTLPTTTPPHSFSLTEQAITSPSPIVPASLTSPPTTPPKLKLKQSKSSKSGKAKGGVKST